MTTDGTWKGPRPGESLDDFRRRRRKELGLPLTPPTIESAKPISGIERIMMRLKLGLPVVKPTPTPSVNWRRQTAEEIQRNVLREKLKLPTFSQDRVAQELRKVRPSGKGMSVGPAAAVEVEPFVPVDPTQWPGRAPVPKLGRAPDPSFRAALLTPGPPAALPGIQMPGATPPDRNLGRRILGGLGSAASEVFKPWDFTHEAWLSWWTLNIGRRISGPLSRIPGADEGAEGGIIFRLTSPEGLEKARDSQRKIANTISSINFGRTNEAETLANEVVANFRDRSTPEQLIGIAADPEWVVGAARPFVRSVVRSLRGRAGARAGAIPRITVEAPQRLALGPGAPSPQQLALGPGTRAPQQLALGPGARAAAAPIQPPRTMPLGPSGRAPQQLALGSGIRAPRQLALPPGPAGPSLIAPVTPVTPVTPAARAADVPITPATARAAALPEGAVEIPVTPKIETIGNVATTEGGQLRSVHVTSDPSRLEQVLRVGGDISQTREPGLVGDLGTSGVYFSNAPQLWTGRATAKWNFLRELNQVQRTNLVESLGQEIRRLRGTRYITESEEEVALRYIREFKERPDFTGGVVQIADQPYNVGFWKPEFLSRIGIKQAKPPVEVPIALRGRFADISAVPSNRRLEAVATLKEQGFDGVLVRGHMMGELPQGVVWNREAIEQFGELSLARPPTPVVARVAEVVPTTARAAEALPTATREVAEAAALPGVPRAAADVPAPTRAAGEGVDIKLAQTGQPFRGSLFRGSGRETLEEIYDPHFVQGPIFGEATYASPSRKFAKDFGPQVDELEVSLRNPLVISSDSEWIALTAEARLISHVPTNAQEVIRLRQVIRSKGHDGVIIRVPESEMVGKRLQQAFSGDTVVSFEPAAPARPTVAPTTATRAADVPTPGQYRGQFRGGGGSQRIVDPAGDDQPLDTFIAIANQATRGEKPRETLLRRHGGAVRAAENEARIIVDKGGASLQRSGIGKAIGGRTVPRQEDIPQLDELFNALHNPSAVERGEIVVAPQFADDFARLRELTNWEFKARIDFDPNMARVDDYFYRGWKPPEGMFADSGELVKGSVGRRPAFKMPRVNATYREMREAGFEPLFWNPYEQWRVSRLQGIRNREQAALINHLKQIELALPNSREQGLIGWRTPDIGPVFRGKPYATVADDGTPVVAFTERWVVPDELANRLETLYGVPLKEVGKIYPFGKEIDLLKVVDAVTFIPKRAKLIGSLFQQIDFLWRNQFGSWAAMVDDLYHGHPVSAVKKLAAYPRSATSMIQANLGPGARLRIRETLNSTEPLLPDRPGVHFRGIMEGGLSVIDPTMLPGDIDKAARVVAQQNNLLGVRSVMRIVAEFESAARRGLFEGWYPAAQITDIRNNIAPMLAREFPNHTDAQLNGEIARRTNLKYSTIPAEQSIFQNRFVRGILSRAFFSPGEGEGLLRQATGAIRGPQSAFWRKHWIGAYVGLLSVANVIHFASTGKPLPAERWVPLSKDNWGPLPVSYNRDFASPNIPLVGRSGVPLMLDLVNQMDTALRILNPGSFLSSRESVPLRAITNQKKAENFYGQPIDTVGPLGGIVSRSAQLASDLFLPIGPGEAALQEARTRIPAVAAVVPETEGRIGTAGRVLQAPGLNIRAETTPQFMDRAVSLIFPDEEFPVKERWMDRFTRAQPQFAPELAERLETSVTRGRGIFSGKLEDINRREQIVYQNLIDTNTVTFQNVRDARKRFAGERRGAGLGEEFSDTSDPILAQYFALFQDPQLRDGFTLDGDINSPRFNEAFLRLKRGLTLEQLEYLKRNTNLRPIPRPIIRALSRAEQAAIQESHRARSNQLLKAGRRDLSEALFNWFYVADVRR